MGRNVFAYALGHGLAGGLDAYADGMQREQQFEQQRRLQQERFDEQERMLQMRGGMGGTGGSSGGTGTRVAGFDPADAEARARFASAPIDDATIAAYDPSVPRRMAEGYAPSTDPNHMNDSGDARPVIGPDGQPLAPGVRAPMILDKDSEQYRGALERLRQTREALAMGAANYDNFQKGRLTDQEVGRMATVEKDMGAAGAQLVSKGKGPYEGDSNVTRNILTGATANTKVGDSNVRENDAQAGKARAEGQDVGAKRKSSAGTEERLVAAEERRQASDLRADIKDVRDRIERTKRSDPERAKLEAELKALEAEQTRLRAGKAAPAGVTRIGNSSVKPLGN